VDAEKTGDALRLHGLRVTITKPHRGHQRKSPGGADGSECARNTGATRPLLKLETGVEAKAARDELHFRTLGTDFIEERILYKGIEKCKTNEAVLKRCAPDQTVPQTDVPRTHDADVDKLLAVRIRRISLFDINTASRRQTPRLRNPRTHAQELEPHEVVAVAHLEACSKQLWPAISPSDHQGPAGTTRLTVKEVASKRSRWPYDRERGYAWATKSTARSSR